MTTANTGLQQFFETVTKGRNAVLVTKLVEFSEVVGIDDPSTFAHEDFSAELSGVAETVFKAAEVDPNLIPAMIRGFLANFKQAVTKLSQSSAAPASTQRPSQPAPQDEDDEEGVDTSKFKPKKLVRLLAEGDRRDDVVAAARSKVPFLLVKRVEGKMIICKDETISLMAETGGQHPGRSHFNGMKVISVEKFLDKKIKLNPWNTSERLLLGTDNEGIDWNSIPDPSQAYVRFLRSRRSPVNSPTDNVHDVAEALTKVGGDYNRLPEIAQRWKASVEAYNEAKESARDEGRSLESELLAELVVRETPNPLADSRREPPSGNPHPVTSLPTTAPDSTEQLDRRLRQVAASLFQDPQDYPRLIADAGLNRGRITLSGPGQTQWANIIEEARRQNAIRQLISVLLDEVPGNSDLQALMRSHFCR